MGLLTPQMKAEMLSKGRQVYPVFEWALPNGTVKLAKSPVASESSGAYKTRVTKWGVLPFGRSDYRNALQSLQTTLVVSDTDRALATAIRALRPEQVQAATATISLFSPNVSDGANPMFTGYVSGVRYLLESMEYELTLRCPDKPLRGRVPRLRITRADWPRAHDSVLGQVVCQGLYGFFKSAGLGVGGALPTQYVDTESFRYLVCHGYALSGDNAMATRVYVDGVEVTSGWSVEYLTRNGRTYTCIKFTGDQGDGVVTLDGNGYQVIGDPGFPGPEGDVIERPTHAIAHWLVNFVWGDYQSGMWADPASEPIDTASLADTDTLFQGWGQKVSKRIATDQYAEDILNEWALSEEVFLYWTRTGRLGFIVEDTGREGTNADDPYPTVHWLRDDQHDLGDWSVSEDDKSVIDGIQVSWCVLPTQNRAMQSLLVENHLLDRAAKDTLTLPWSPAYLV
jgi:hypothetical protein